MVVINHNVNNLGFTLIEMLVTLTIMGVIIAIGAPMMISQLKNMEAQAVANALQGFLKEGKQTALIYRNPVILCIADENKQCQPHGGQFLLSFIDKNNNQVFDNTDTLHSHSKLTLRYGRLVTRTSLSKPIITMRADSGNPVGAMGHIKYCPTDGNTRNMFKISFNITGIIKFKPNIQEPTEC